MDWGYPTDSTRYLDPSVLLLAFEHGTFILKSKMASPVIISISTFLLARRKKGKDMIISFKDTTQKLQTSRLLTYC